METEAGNYKRNENTFSVWRSIYECETSISLNFSVD